MECVPALATRIPTRGIGLIGLCCCLALGTAGAAFGKRPRTVPSRTSFRHFDNMNGWMPSAVATAVTCIPGTWLRRTAASLNSFEYL